MTLLAPIHIAVSRELIDTVKALIAAGADVNIVGSNDVMPLSIAHQLDGQEKAAKIIQCLTER